MTAVATVPRAPMPRALVVDDEHLVRQTYMSVLSDAGWVVEAAASGHRALSILMQHPFDVLVVDLRMEGMDGLVFLEEALRMWPHLGVVIVSGYVNDKAVARAAALGVRRVLQKPVDRRHLCDAVLNEARGRLAAGRAGTEAQATVALMRDHLRLLTRLGDSRSVETLAATLRDFGRSLARTIPCSALGVLVVRDDEQSLLLAPFVPVAETFLAQMRQTMFARLEALSGRAVSREAVSERREGPEPGPAGAAYPAASVVVPLIVGNRVDGVLAMASAEPREYGASDVSLLYHAVHHVVAIYSALRTMHQLSAKDPLTGAFNRIRLQEELERAWLYSRRYDTSMAVVIVDVDNFKTLNDSYGHSAGDAILREFTAIMSGVARASDVIARYGGDEFVTILPRATEEDAAAFAQRLVNGARQHVFCHSTHRLRLTISAGIATSDNPTSPATSAELLSQADRALYMAKRAGRDRVCAWPAEFAVPPAPAEPGRAAPGAPPHPSRGGRVALVDDERAILDVISAILRGDGFSVEPFVSADAALHALRSRRGEFDLLLTDISLPEKSGIELLHELADDTLLVKVVMPGFATVSNAVSCLREGAYDFIQKPVEHDSLVALMRRAMEYRRLKVENERYHSHLEQMVRDRSAQLANSFEEIKKSYEFTLEALVAMLDAREHQTGRHSLRVRELAVTLAREMGLDGEDLQSVATGALLHDIGKIGIPDSILFRPGPLQPDEWKVMQEHCEIGYRIVRSSPYLREAAEIVWAHQEFYDGSGYPRGLKGRQICMGARIFAVVDAYDAMRSQRVYRDPVGPDEAVADICRCSGTQFDPDVVAAFLRCQPELDRLLNLPNASL